MALPLANARLAIITLIDLANTRAVELAAEVDPIDTVLSGKISTLATNLDNMRIEVNNYTAITVDEFYGASTAGGAAKTWTSILESAYKFMDYYVNKDKQTVLATNSTTIADTLSTNVPTITENSTTVATNIPTITTNSTTIADTLSTNIPTITTNSTTVADTLSGNIPTITTNSTSIAGSQESIATSDSSIATSTGNISSDIALLRDRGINWEKGIYVATAGEDTEMRRALLMNALRNSKQLDPVREEYLHPTPFP